MKFEEFSKRYVPEAINFILNALLHLLPTNIDNSSSLPGFFPVPDFESESLRPLHLTGKGPSGIVPKSPNVLDMLSMSGLDNSEQDKIDLADQLLTLLGKYAEIYKPLDAFPEIFDPARQILSCVKLPTSYAPLQVRALLVVSRPIEIRSIMHNRNA